MDLVGKIGFVIYLGCFCYAGSTLWGQYVGREAVQAMPSAYVTPPPKKPVSELSRGVDDLRGKMGL